METTEQSVRLDRNYEAVHIRMLAMYLCRKVAGMGFRTIGKSFGDYDHSTVISAVRKVATIAKTDIDLQKAISTLTPLIEAELVPPQEKRHGLLSIAPQVNQERPERPRLTSLAVEASVERTEAPVQIVPRR